MPQGHSWSRILPLALLTSLATMPAFAAERDRPPATPPGSSSVSVDAQQQAPAFEVQTGALSFTGLLPTGLGGPRIVDLDSGRSVSMPEMFEAIGRPDLAEELQTRLIGRWLLLGGAGVLGVGALGAFATAGGFALLGAPAAFPWGATALASMAAAAGGVLLTGAGAAAVLGMAVQVVPVDEDELRRMASMAAPAVGPAE